MKDTDVEITLPVGNSINLYDFLIAIAEGLYPPPHNKTEDCLQKHFEQLLMLARAERVVLLNLDFVSTTEPDFEATISRKHAIYYLDEFGLPFSSAVESTQKIKAVSRTEQHKSEILNMLATLGYNPLALPRKQKAGARSEAKQKARAKLPRITKDTFDKNWQALRNDGKIKDSALGGLKKS